MRQRRKSRRSGIAWMWLIISAPVLLLALCVLVEVGNLWVARGELVRSCEAAALAAVKHWKTGASTADVRLAAESLADSNQVRGTDVDLDEMEGLFANGNKASGEILLGAAASLTELDATMSVGDPTMDSIGVRVTKSFSVSGPCSSVFGSFMVSAQVDAVFLSGGGSSPRLTTFTTFTGP